VPIKFSFIKTPKCMVVSKSSPSKTQDSMGFPALKIGCLTE